MSLLFNIEQWDSDARYLVLDDVPFDDVEFTRVRKGLWGGQQHFNITGKWRKHMEVKGLPVIFCCNESNDFKNIVDQYGRGYLKQSELEWYEANTLRVEVTTKLFADENMEGLDSQPSPASVRRRRLILDSDSE